MTRASPLMRNKKTTKVYFQGQNLTILGRLRNNKATIPQIILITIRLMNLKIICQWSQFKIQDNSLRIILTKLDYTLCIIIIHNNNLRNFTNTSCLGVTHPISTMTKTTNKLNTNNNSSKTSTINNHNRFNNKYKKQDPT